MAGVTPLTSIDEGAAQVFDTTSLIQKQKAEKQAREDKLLESTLDYDPNDIWQRDVPQVSTQIDKYQSWMTQNYDRLTSGGKERMQAWTEKKSMENQIRNEIAASKQAGTSVQQMTKMIMTDPDYNTPANRELLANFTKAQSADAYQSKEAYNTMPIQQQFQKDVVVPIEDIANHVGEAFFSADEMRTYGTKGIGDKRTISDQKGLDSYLMGVWNNGSDKSTAQKIQGKFGTFDAFKSSVLDNVDTSVKTIWANPQTGTVPPSRNRQFTEFEGGSGFNVGAASTEVGGNKTIVKKHWFRANENIAIPEDSKVIKDENTGESYILDSAGKRQAVTSSDAEDQASYYPLAISKGLSIEPMGITISGVIGGVNVNDGSYSPNLFGTSSKLQISDIVLADEATKPVYVKYQGTDKQGNSKEYKKLVSTNEVIPDGAQLFSDADYSKPIEMGDRFKFIQPSMYAAVNASTPVIKPQEGNALQEETADTGYKSTSAKGLVKYNKIASYVANFLPNYPGLQDKINAIQNAPNRQDADYAEYLRLRNLNQ